MDLNGLKNMRARLEAKLDEFIKYSTSIFFKSLDEI